MAVSADNQVSAELRLREPMSRHTTWRVGGPAARWYRPANLEELAGFLAGLPVHDPVFMIGLGSNLLVRDGGIDGTVIATAGTLGQLGRIDEERVLLEAGVACAKAARFCAREGLAGAEFLAGIPGTIGGALAMNAGCFGSETWERVESVQTIDRQGVFHVRTPEEFELGYRHVRGPADEWFAATVLRLEPGGDGEMTARMKEYLARRAATQPLGRPNAGSVFRNPPGDHAARLIEAAGLKGHSIGGAVVSEKHANFIINEGDASAADIEDLILYVQQQVAELHGVMLEPEVRIVGRRSGEETDG